MKTNYCNWFLAFAFSAFVLMLPDVAAGSRSYSA